MRQRTVVTFVKAANLSRAKTAFIGLDNCASQLLGCLTLHGIPYGMGSALEPPICHALVPAPPILANEHVSWRVKIKVFHTLDMGINGKY